MFKKMLKGSGLVVGCTALAACGTLLWEVTYQLDQPTISSVLATDSDKNIYVGGGKRISATYILDQDYNAILLKYDDAGDLRMSLIQI